MAIYRCEARIITRGKGHSAVAAAAYRTGTKIQDERAGITHNYSSRQKGVVESVILRPEKSPEWTADTATLWNEVERSEKRKDARLAREFILTLPRELSPKEQIQLSVEWAQSNLVSKGMVVEVSLHNPKGGNNPHAHVLCTMRTRCKFSTGWRCASLRAFRRLLASVSSLVRRLVCLPVALSWA
jgi:hypothetical protein